MKMSTLMMEYNQKTKNNFLKALVKDLLNSLFIKSYIRIYKMNNTYQIITPHPNMLSDSELLNKKETNDAMYMEMPQE